MLRKRFLAAALVAGSAAGLAGGGAMTAPATSADTRFVGPVLGYCREQASLSQKLTGHILGIGIACLDNPPGYPIGPECMYYTREMDGTTHCEPWPV